jgi:hypothetical protein
MAVPAVAVSPVVNTENAVFSREWIFIVNLFPW